MDCITHGLSQITPCYCIVYLLLWSALYQQDFVALLKENMHQMVSPVVERAIHSLPLPDKLAIAFSDEEPVELLDRIAKIDFEARKLVYQYLKLMLTI